MLSNDGHGGQLSAAPLQISQTDDPNHPYIGVFHALEKGTSVFNTYLSYSSDLMSWHTIGMIHHAASMPNLRILSD
ncbi:hypothetical protein, partial [Pseudomonas protegens]|uniref:hypothetical protein n=1 Tax=Pseudomonas protegens TaxID=380021 RepID=UPI001CA47FD9